MSVSTKLASSFGAHAVVALLGIGTVPLYLSIMGPEGFGLVGFHVTLQAWMMVLDMGVPTAIARRLSLWQANKDSHKVAPLLKAVERMFWLFAGLAMLAIAAGSPWIVRQWLGRSELETLDLVGSLRLMGGLIALRWTVSLYQAALIGLERQNLVNRVIIASALCRTIAAVTTLLLVSRSPQSYFAAHLAGALGEVLILRVALMRIVPWQDAAPCGLRTLIHELRFAGGFALVTVIWLAVNQTDKLVLSHTLSLKDFGVFSVVSAICVGLATLVPAFTQALQPRLTTLLAQRRRGEFTELYRLSAALLLAGSASAAGTVATFPVLTFYAWTGNFEQGLNLGRVLTVYAAGTGVANILLAPFLLQYACGDIRVHVRSYALLGAVWIPGVVWCAYGYGPWGTGVAWLTGNVVLLAVCWSLAHRLLLSGPERKGMYASLFTQLVVMGGTIALLSVLMPVITSRIGAVAALISSAATLMSVGIWGSSDLRRYFSDRYRRTRMGL